jgi:hypothetical protein
MTDDDAPLSSPHSAARTCAGSVLVRKPLESRIHFLAASLRFAIARKTALQAENVTLRRKLAHAERALERADEAQTLFYATLIHNVVGAPAAGDPAEAGRSPSSAPATPTRRIFRDRQQAIEFAGQLLRRFGLETYWSPEGLELPADDRSEPTASLSTTERVLLVAADDLISEDPGLAFLDILEHLRGAPLRTLCTFMMAFAEGTEALERWSSEEASAPPGIHC